jgi:hypothetical protein
MLKTRIQICIVYSISYLFAIKEKRLKTDYRINTVSDRFHPKLVSSDARFNLVFSPSFYFILFLKLLKRNSILFFVFNSLGTKI